MWEGREDQSLVPNSKEGNPKANQSKCHHYIASMLLLIKKSSYAHTFQQIHLTHTHTHTHMHLLTHTHTQRVQVLLYTSTTKGLFMTSVDLMSSHTNLLYSSHTKGLGLI